MPQFRSVQRTIEAEPFDGTADSVDTLTKWGTTVEKDGTGQYRIELNSNHTKIDIYPGDWVVKTIDGFTVIDGDEFASSYVGARADDEQSVVFKMTTVDGATLTATVEGWKDGKDAVRALMHIGRPEVVLEFVKEQVLAGDMSMMSLMHELAAMANPGE